ncbi:HAD family phosphatase [Campylobacter sp. VicNov18]|uniref:HAD family hydrolase n=1 Tax=Campylobacter bilis TaxID=2691918 RepID=UPI00130EFBC7|nr:HAD family phosphatase [Campylobacter bilis]MPV64254.1 HAD-IA family hydrolase [Campylobacter hepaticus]MBM0637760.1 HAD-IA family hydrolase [Campylobacter bilis]MCC8278486.1 HAD family phosphatase [Campylobacter bilis]MCC8299996.1 HAD family phosphatase [Campylobacter bilis]MCC8301395.1 HAD family phosphatase [Campylobacter bilis]
MIKIKAIIFDMDGVLIEAKDWHYQALNKALKLFGMEISRYEHLTTFDGLPTKDKLKMLSLDRGLPESLHNFINELKQQYTMEMVYSLCKPKFHHQYALSKLKNEDYKMAVCSNSIRNSIEIMMEKSALENYLDFYISNEDVKQGKPDPEMYNKAIEKLGFNPKECMIIEDNENGIKAARLSGANVMIVREIDEVNYENIKSHILKFEKEAKC